MFRDKVLNESVSVYLTAISTYLITGLSAEGFSSTIAMEGFVSWPAWSSNHSLSLIEVLNTDGMENQTNVDPYEHFAYSQNLILHSMGSVMSSEGPNQVRMVLSPLNLTDLFGFVFAQDFPEEPSMYFIHDVNADVGNIVVIWLGRHGEVVSRDDFDTRIGVLPALHINWSRTWTTVSPFSDNSQAFHFIYDQLTGFLISATISGSSEWDVGEMVWNQRGSIESTNMHLPRSAFKSPFFVLVIFLILIPSIVFLVLALYIHRRYLR